MAMTRRERQVPRVKPSGHAASAIGGDKRGIYRPDLSRRYELSRVENVQWIQRLLQRAHGFKRLFAEFRLQIFLLALPDAVLAGAGAVHRLRALNQPMRELLAARHLIGVGGVAEHGAMEIAVADMADDRRQQLEALEVRLGLRDAVAQA